MRLYLNAITSSTFIVYKMISSQGKLQHAPNALKNSQMKKSLIKSDSNQSRTVLRFSLWSRYYLYRHFSNQSKPTIFLSLYRHFSSQFLSLYRHFSNQSSQAVFLNLYRQFSNQSFQAIFLRIWLMITRYQQWSRTLN
jgi:hypothetical protein